MNIQYKRLVEKYNESYKRHFVTRSPYVFYMFTISGYFYLFDSTDDSLHEFDTSLDMTQKINLEKLIDYYETNIKS